MKIDTAGTYTLRYTATDECGNVGTKDRTVNVTAITYRTVLYADGTFIINEKSSDQAANEALHGSAQNVYVPLDPNGASWVDRYEFSGLTNRPWNSQSGQVLSVEVGSPIRPTTMAYWFRNFTSCTAFDLHNIDMSDVTTMMQTFAKCTSLITFDWSIPNLHLLTSLNGAFWSCSSLKSVSLSWSNLDALRDINTMFKDCSSLEVVDISSFVTPSLTQADLAFEACGKLKTIYGSENFDNTPILTQDVFTKTYVLVGGAGTTWAYAKRKGSYAHIDGGTANPGFFTAKA